MPPTGASGRRGPAVRAARSEDAGALRDLYVELADSTDALPAEVGVTAGLLTQIAGQTDRQLLVAVVDGGRVAGTLDLLIVPNVTHGGRPWAIVENVVVAEAHRRQGVGRALMQSAMQSARQAGCYKVQLTSAKHRGEAHEFYRSLGFGAVAEGFKIYFDR
jgi:GNAT superfamily N-acetyltransferase